MSLYKVALTNLSYQSSIDHHRYQTKTKTFPNTANTYQHCNKPNYVEGKMYYFINDGYYAFYPNDSFHYYRVIESQSDFLDQTDTDHWHSFHYTSKTMADKYVLQHVDEFIAILDYNHMEVITYVVKADYEEALERALRSTLTNTLSSPTHNSSGDESFDSDEDDEFDLIEEFDQRRRKSKIDAAFLKFLEDDDEDTEYECEGSDELKTEDDVRIENEGPLEGEGDSSELVLFDYSSWNKENETGKTLSPSFSTGYCGKTPSYQIKKRRYNQEIC